MGKDAYVVCRIFRKNGPGPQNGAQYGAPFNEEEWEENDGNMIMLGEVGVDDFNDSREQQQEHLHINDFVLVNSLLKKYFIVCVLKFE